MTSVAQGNTADGREEYRHKRNRSGDAMKSIENLLIVLIVIGLLIMAGGFVAQAMAKKKKQS